MKIVPGASDSRIAGWLGEALKLRVAAPPEKEKANSAVVSMLASALEVPRRSIEIASGAASANKVVEVSGVSQDELDRRLARL